MLINAMQLDGFSLTCRDGDLGRLKELYFDDLHWTIRYLIADTRDRFPGRRVLISPYAVTGIDPDGRRIAIDLTMQQIAAGPPLASDLPVSRQFEEDYHRFHGWPPYWGGTHLWGAFSGLLRDPAARTRSAGRAQGGDQVQAPRHLNQHLRSSHDIIGHHFHATDGELGQLADLIIDDDTWTIRYLVIDTRNLWPGRQVLIAPQWIERISWGQSMIFINHTRDTIHQAPDLAASNLITRDYEARLHRHYARSGYWNLRPAGSATGS